MTLGDRIRMQPAGAAATPRASRAPRGRVWLYAIAFGMLLIAGWLQVKGNLHSRLRLVWWSIGLSIAATLVALASVLVPGRRLRTSPAEGAASTSRASTAATVDARSDGKATTEPDADSPETTEPEEPTSEPAESELPTEAAGDEEAEPESEQPTDKPEESEPEPTRVEVESDSPASIEDGDAKTAPSAE